MRKILLLTVILLALGMLANACGGDDPTPAPAGPSLSEQDIQAAIDSAVAGATASGTTADEVQSIVEAAVAAAAAADPEGLTAAQVQTIVEAAVAASAAADPEGLTAAEVQTIVEAAVATAAAAAPAADPEGLTAAQVQTIVSGAIAANTPPTAVPTAVVQQIGVNEAHQQLLAGGPKALAAANGETPRYGGKFLTSGPELIPTGDMQQTSLGGVYTTTAPLYNGLLATSPYDTGAELIIPDLATSWDISEDGLTITFNLAGGVRWHDGAPFSSDDVLFTMNRILNPPEGAVMFSNGSFNTLFESFEAPDANTFVVHATKPAKLAVQIFANGFHAVLPKHILEPDPVNALVTPTMASHIGTGPFRLSEDPTITQWLYERNTDYFKSNLPYLDEIEYNIIDDDGLRANAILTRRTYWLDSAPHANMSDDQAQALRDASDDIVISNATSLTAATVSLSTTREPFDDIRVRQAISEAIDRAFVSTVSSNRNTVGTALHPLGSWVLPPERQAKLIGYGPDMEVRREHARELLADYEADKGEIDWGSKSLQCSVNHDFSVDYCQIVQPMLKAVGIDIPLEMTDVGTVRGNEISGEYDMSMLGAAMNFYDPTSTFGAWYITNGSRWYQHRSLPELDDLWAAQDVESDLEKRRELVWEMDELAMNDAASLIMGWFIINHAKWDFVKGWTATPDIRSTNARMEYVWLDFPQLPTSRP